MQFNPVYQEKNIKKAVSQDISEAGFAMKQLLLKGDDR
tara:strand:- start:30662 stop:30775 length:114 start_codon:yes stop_codon:yes gene_type:complete